MPASPGLLALLPAAVTILVALVGRRVWPALACGLLAGALALGHFQAGTSAQALLHGLGAALLDPERLKIICFILLVGGLLEVLAASGAYQAFAEALSRVLNSARRTRLAAWGLSFCLFFDDYANVLITGSSMRGIGRRNGVRPAMMAYFVDVVAILASVMLVSTWAAFEGSEMAAGARAAGLPHGATELFLASLPYHFYTVLAVLLSLAVALSGRWFGARLDTHRFMAIQDRPAAGRGARLRHVVAPLLTLILGAFLGLFAVGAWRLWRKGEPLGLLKMLWAAPAVDVLLGATLLALALAVYLFKRDGVLGRHTVRPAFGRGVRDMLEIALIIVLATGLSKVSTELGAGAYLAGLLTKGLAPALIPAAVYALATLVTVSTGFSWGSMSIVLPVAFSLALGGAAAGAALPPLVPVLCGAAITGAVAGEHLIPYSEKAVLSATACGIPPVYHFKTQLPQTLAAWLGGGLAFLLLGGGWGLGLAYALPLGLLALGHAFLARSGRQDA